MLTRPASTSARKRFSSPYLRIVQQIRSDRLGRSHGGLHELADCLQDCGVRTVAMESTGVYWIPLYQILETRGFQVFLVNAQHVKNVPGRKSDVSDCQWIQYLHRSEEHTSELQSLR